MNQGMDRTVDEATLHGTRPAQGSPVSDGMERSAPSGVSAQHPLLHEKVRLAVVLFLISEFIFFVFLVVAYVYSRQGEISGPTAHSSLVPWKTGIYTAVLLTSSGTIYLAERSLEHRRRAFAFWMSLTIALGSIFLFGEMREYATLLHHDVSVSRNLFGSTFFTLTGFHAVHVTLGLVMLAVLLGLVFFDKLGAKRRTAFKSVSYYWHFVDLVWIMVFSVVYLWSAR